MLLLAVARSWSGKMRQGKWFLETNNSYLTKHFFSFCKSGMYLSALFFHSFFVAEKKKRGRKFFFFFFGSKQKLVGRCRRLKKGGLFNKRMFNFRQGNSKTFFFFTEWGRIFLIIKKKLLTQPSNECGRICFVFVWIFMLHTKPIVPDLKSSVARAIISANRVVQGKSGGL